MGTIDSGLAERKMITYRGGLYRPFLLLIKVVIADGYHVSLFFERQQEERCVWLIRALFNIRQPMPVSKEFLNIQDEYLSEEAKEKGIVCVNELPVSEASGLPGSSVFPIGDFP